MSRYAEAQTDQDQTWGERGLRGWKLGVGEDKDISDSVKMRCDMQIEAQTVHESGA